MAEFIITTPLGEYTVTAPDEATAIKLVADEMKTIAESSDKPEYRGVAFNTTAGLNEAIYGTLGAPVDAMRGALNLGVRGINAVTGSEIPYFPKDAVGGSQWIGEQLGKINPALDPANTTAETTPEKIARGVGQGVGYTVAPEAAVAGASRAGVLTGAAADIFARLFGRGESVASAATNAAVGGAAGGGSTAAMEAAPDPWKPLAGVAGGLAAGTAMGAAAVGAERLASAGVKVARDGMAPLTEAGRERLAADRFRDNATDFDAFRRSLDEGVDQLVPGSEPTTFQATGDMGVGAMERGAAARQPDVFNDRRAAQNAARVDALKGIQAEGAPETVAAAIRQQVTQIDAAAQKMVDDAQEVARRSAEVAGQGITPETAGTALRKALADARDTAKAAERQLWDAVDPDGTLGVGSANTKATAKRLITDMPASAKAPSGEEASIYATLGKYDDIVPLRELTALDSRLKTEMRAEKIANGQSPAYRRMTILKGAIEKDLSDAVSGKVADEAQAVKSGAMDAEQTIVAKLMNDVGEWRAQREAAAGQVGGTGSSGTTPGGASTVSGSYRAEGTPGGGLGEAPRDPRLSADAVNLDEAARQRLTDARKATLDRVETYDNRTLAPVADQATLASSVPEKIFVPGAKGFETVQTYRKAVGDQEAMDALQGYISDRLRRTAMRPDGTLDPRKVTAFRTTYKDALRAFPDLDARFADAASASSTLDDVARWRTDATADAEKGALGRVMKLQDPEDVTNTVGAIFSAQDSAQQMLKLRNMVASDAQAKVGLRKAVVDFMTNKFVGNTEAGTSGVGTVKSDAFQTFVKSNRAALRNAGFTDAEIGTMTKIADDLQRANRSIASVKIPGGSNTAQDTLAVGKADSGSTLFAKVLANLAAPGAGATVGYAVTGNPLGAAAGAAGAGVLAELRRHGLQTIDDIVADALLNPDRARILMRSASTPKQEETAIRELAKTFGRTVAPTSAVTAQPDQPKTPQAAARQAQQMLLGQ